MLKLTRETRKQLVEKFPYLEPRNVWREEKLSNYDYSWIVGESDLPDGWFRLFLLFCKEVQPLLIQENWLNRFMFTQVKEKYGTMRLYNNGAPENVHRITTLFEAYSYNICEYCGKKATKRTSGWVSSVCDNCSEQVHTSAERFIPRKMYTYESFDAKNDYWYSVSFTLKDVNKEYTKIVQLTDEEFIQYLLS